MKTFLLIAHNEKEMTWRIALNWTAHVEEIGELEGKKSLPPGVREVMGSIPVGDSDFLFVPRSWQTE